MLKATLYLFREPEKADYKYGRKFQAVRLDMPAPKRARRRPWCPYKRIPIPFVTKVPEDGSRVKFSIEDRECVERCGARRLCQFCGESLDAIIVFLGGETATSLRLFRQAPFHEECARFAVATCPYLRNTYDPQFATFCRRFEMRLAEYPYTEPGQITVMKAFVAHAIVRVEPVGKWAA